MTQLSLVGQDAPSIGSPQNTKSEDETSNNNVADVENKASVVEASEKSSTDTDDDEDDSTEEETTVDMNEDATLMDVIEAFAQGTSIHGLPYLFNFENYTFRKRRVWFPIIILSTTFMIIQATQLINEYIAYDVNVNIHQTFPFELDFPQITVCNLNPFDTSRQAATGIGEPRNEMEVENISLPLENFIYLTHFNIMRNIPVEQAWKPVITPHGRCFVFQTNATIAQPGFSSNDQNSGLTFLVNVHPELYNENASLIAGVRLFISEQGKPITEYEENILISPGVEALVGMRRTQHYREPLDPWAQCQSHVPDYDQTVCRSECYNEFIRNGCKCRRMGDNTTNLPYCTQRHRNVCPAFLVPPRLYLEDCDCFRPPCFEDTYETVMTSATFSPRYIHMVAAHNRDRIMNDYMHQYEALQNATPQEVERMTRDYVANSFMFIKVNYEVMELDVITENIAMTFPSLMSQLGGLMGLYLGISVISLVELFGELFALRLIPRLWGNTRLHGIGSR